MRRSYKPCPCFKGYDTEENILATSRCLRCGGKGYIPKPELVCNGCGGSMHLPDSHDPDGVYGLGPVSVTGGYSSPHLSDLSEYTFCLCELCLRKLFDTFKVPPSVSGLSVSGERRSEHVYAEDRASWVHRMWLDSGGPERKLPSGKCTYEEGCENEGVLIEIDQGRIRHLNRYCKEHEYSAYFVSGIDVRPVPVEEMTLGELRLLELRYVSKMFGPGGEYSLADDDIGYYDLWCPDVVHLAEEIPVSTSPSTGETEYSVLYLRPRPLADPDVDKLLSSYLSEFVVSTREYVIGCEFIRSYVMKVPLHFHRGICSVPGIRHSAYGLSLIEDSASR